MPLSLQGLSPEPDFEAIDSAQNRVPKLAVRGRGKPSPVVATTIPTIAPPSPTSVRPAFKEKCSKESFRSSDEGTLATPTSPTSVAPWDLEKERKYEPRPATSHSDNFTTSTNERHSSEATKQPFRQEVPPSLPLEQWLNDVRLIP